MSPYALEVPQSLHDVERAVIDRLNAVGGTRMTELLKALEQYNANLVKAAVWHLIDTGVIRLEMDRRLVKAS